MDIHDLVYEMYILDFIDDDQHENLEKLLENDREDDVIEWLENNIKLDNNTVNDVLDSYGLAIADEIIKWYNQPTDYVYNVAEVLALSEIDYVRFDNCNKCKAQLCEVEFGQADYSVLDDKNSIENEIHFHTGTFNDKYFELTLCDECSEEFNQFIFLM